LNLREMIKRKITYSEVIVSYEGKSYSYIVYGVTTPKKEMKKVLNIVYGVTTPKKEMKKVLKDYKGEEIPRITVITVTERRAISLENFIKNSILISEGEEN